MGESKQSGDKGTDRSEEDDSNQDHNFCDNQRYGRLDQIFEFDVAYGADDEEHRANGWRHEADREIQNNGDGKVRAGRVSITIPQMKTMAATNIMTTIGWELMFPIPAATC
jgi:hypothetical protein